MGHAIRDRRRHQAVYFIHFIVHRRRLKRRVRHTHRDRRLGGCPSREERTALRYFHQYRQRHSQVTHARQRERHCLAFLHGCRVCRHADHRQVVIDDYTGGLTISDRCVGSIAQRDGERLCRFV